MFSLSFWRSLSLATIPSGFEINNIGVQATISSAITLAPCSTCFAYGSEQPSHLSQPTKSASGKLGSSAAAGGVKTQTSQTETRSARPALLGHRSPIPVFLDRVAPARYARDRGPLAPRWIPTVLGQALQSATASRGNRISQELRDLILQMVVENPTWGAPRIHGELLMLGFEAAERTISCWMRRAPRNLQTRHRSRVPLPFQSIIN